jgi:hypothetical protein
MKKKNKRVKASKSVKVSKKGVGGEKDERGVLNPDAISDRVVKKMSRMWGW